MATGEARRDEPSLRSSTSWMVYSYTASLTLQGGYFILIARRLEAGEFGSFAAALAVVSIISPLASFGSGHLMLMHTARARSSYRDWLATSLLTTLTCGGLLTLSVLLISRALPGAWQVTGVLLPLALSELFFARLSEVAAQSFQAHDHVRSSATVLVTANALRFAAVLGFLASGQRTASAWSWYYLAAAATAGASAMAWVFRRYGLPGSPRHLRMVSRQGIFFAIGVAAKSAYADIDKAMLARMASAQATGIYTAAYRVLSMAAAPITALLYASNARMFREGGASLRAAWSFGRRLLPMAVGYATVASIGMFVAAPLMPLMLGPSYTPAASALRWLAPLTIIQAVHFLLGDTLMGAGRQSIRSMVQVGAALINVLANLVLIPTLSWKGAALASLLTEGLLAAALVVILWRLVARERSYLAGQEALHITTSGAQPPGRSTPLAASTQNPDSYDRR